MYLYNLKTYIILNFLLIIINNYTFTITRNSGGLGSNNPFSLIYDDEVK